METIVVAPAAEIDPQVAAEWIGRWDAQQEGYIADREERFAVLADVVAAAVRGVAEPVVVDLGCGPGSLAARLSTRIPHARFVGVDADPLLVGLARAHYGDLATWVLADLADDAWADALPSTIHAAVSTTALHWMDAGQLAALYRTLAARTAPGGVFADGDHLALADGGLTAIAEEVRAGRAERAGVRDREDWQAWWDGVLGDPRLEAVTAGRTRAASAHPQPDPSREGTSQRAGSEQIGEAQHHHGSNRLSVTDHAGLLRAAGYAAAGPVWQSGEDHVLVGLR